MFYNTFLMIIYIYIYLYINEVLDAGPSYLTNPLIRDRPLWSVLGVCLKPPIAHGVRKKGSLEQVQTAYPENV